MKGYLADLNQEKTPCLCGIDLNRLKCKSEVNLERKPSIGTLGGGNHFIEANQDGRGIYMSLPIRKPPFRYEVARLVREEAFHR